jgi:hypothetical protein
VPSALLIDGWRGVVPPPVSTRDDRTAYASGLMTWSVVPSACLHHATGTWCCGEPLDTLLVWEPARTCLLRSVAPQSWSLEYMVSSGILGSYICCLRYDVAKYNMRYSQGFRDAVASASAHPHPGPKALVNHTLLEMILSSEDHKDGSESSLNTCCTVADSDAHFLLLFSPISFTYARSTSF